MARTYKPTGRPPGRPKGVSVKVKRQRSTSATPIDDYRMGDLPLSEAAVRYVELCNGIESRDISEAFAADFHQRDAIQQGIRRAVKEGRLRAEGEGQERLYFPRRFGRRAA